MSNHAKTPPKMPPKVPMGRHGGTPVRMKGEKLDFKVIKRIFSYFDTKQKVLLALVVVCIFLSSLANIFSSSFVGNVIDGSKLANESKKFLLISLKNSLNC